MVPERGTLRSESTSNQSDNGGGHDKRSIRDAPRRAPTRRVWNRLGVGNDCYEGRPGAVADHEHRSRAVDNGTDIDRLHGSGRRMRRGRASVDAARPGHSRSRRGDA